MKFTLKFLKKLPSPKKNIAIKRICFHECCHAVVARLFGYKMEGIIINTKLVKPGEDFGTLNIMRPHLDHPQNCTGYAITLLAGVIGENIYLMGTNAIKEKKEDILANDNIIDWISGGGDIPDFQNLAFTFSLLYQIDVHKLKEFCIRFLIDFLSDKEIWFMVEKLCDKLLKKNSLKLNEKELEYAFEQIGLDALLDYKRKKYLKLFDEVLRFLR